MNLEAETAGMIHQYLDKYISHELMHRYLDVWKSFKAKGSIFEDKSVLIGQLYGGGLRMFSNVLGKEEEDIQEKELFEYNELFFLRLEGINKEIEKLINNEEHIGY